MTEILTTARRLVLTATQALFWACRDTYQNLEGAVRSGKTTICLMKVGHRCEAYAGLHAMISRWHQSDTDAQLRARFQELFGDRCRWNAREEYFEFPNASRVYVRGLKPSEGASLFSKFAGLTLGLIYIDQPEEMPHEVFQALKARLSQPGMPNELYLSPNPPDEEHWLCEEFPLTDSNAFDVTSRPGYRYIRTTVYDNRANLDADYIPRLEADYPAGHVLRRRFIEGRRGLSVIGTPVYKGYFARARHLRTESRPWLTAPSALFDPAVALFESWDFGHSSPCVTWHQLQRGGARWVVLGGVQGRSLFLEDFAPAVLDIRRHWFPVSALSPTSVAVDLVRRRRRHSAVERQTSLNVESVGDPAGATNNSQGTNRSAVTVLQDMGIFVLTQQDANTIERRNYAIQVAAGYMERNLPDGSPCFLVSDRFVVISRDKAAQERSLLVDGLEAGYVWDALSTARSASPNTRRPKKDGTFDHSANTCEYAWLRWAPAAPAKLAGVFHTEAERQRSEREQQRVEDRALKLAQIDRDPDDAARGNPGTYFRSNRRGPTMSRRLSRGGY